MTDSHTLPHRSELEQKAIRKFPFTLNNQTYFSTECFFENTIINGISLQVKEGKGISSQLKAISYLTYSNRLIFYVGCQILSYNTYKRKYELISQCLHLVCLKAFSLSTAEKQYIVWVENVGKEEDRKSCYVLCVYDMNSKQKIYQEKFTKINKEFDSKDLEIIVFMHPIKVVGFLHYDAVQQETNLSFKKMNKVHEETEFGQEILLRFQYPFRQIRYDLQSNSYFFIKNEYELWSLQCLIDQCNEDGTYLPNQKSDLSILSVDQLLYIKQKDPKERIILDYAISQAHLAILTCSQNNERDIQFYSLFSYGFIFSQNIDSSDTQEVSEHPNDEDVTKTPKVRQMVAVDAIEFTKNILIGLRNNSTEISIYSLFEQSLRHVRDSILDIANCYKIEKMFINPFSSEVLVLSRHYELEGAISTTLKSTKIIMNKSEMKYRNFYLDVSSFYLTTEASVIDVQKMHLQKKNYVSVLTAPWISQFIIQTQSSVKTKNSQEKFDANIKCSAIHPTGQYIALGFTDCFKIYFLTYEGLIHTFMSENTKECISLSYSKQGQDFAVATPITILVYDCYSYEKKHQICLGISYRIEEISYIEGYENNKIKESLQCVTSTKRLVCYNPGRNYAEQFAFNPKTHLETGIFDGIMAIIQFKPNKPVVQSDTYQNFIAASLLNGDGLNKNGNQTNSNKKSVSAIVYDQQTGIVIFSFGPKLYFISSINFECLGCFDFEQISCIELSRSLKTLFFGTASGKILAFPWPNKPINITCKIPTFWTHKSRVKKIKVTSNMFELISITDESMFIHSITLIHEMRKIQKHELQRQFCPRSLVSIDLLIRTGVCLFTGEKFEEKCQLIKENQQEAVNVLFMLPEQRQKQKLGMLNKLETEREKKSLKIQEEGVPLKIDAINIKEKTKNLEKTFKNFTINYESSKEKEIERYQQKISELNKEKDELRIKHAQVSKQLEKQYEAKKEEMRLQLIKTEAVYRMKIEEVVRQTNEAEMEKKKNANNFYELAEMDVERSMLSHNIIQHIQGQISELLQRNGYLSCRNTNLEKDISTKKRKIQDIKELIQSTERTIRNLPKKGKSSQKPEDIKEQTQINKQFAETERRYLKETKKLIEKNKAINVSIELYEKQRELLIILENELEKAERSIEEILDYIMKEKQEKKNIQDKLDLLIQKTKRIVHHYENKNALRIKVKNILNEYLFQLTLYQEGVIDIKKLKKLSCIKLSQMLSPPENIHVSIEEKKRKIGKIESSEEKILNVMKNERKIYSNENRKTCVHNQDLLVNYNFLLHENKHLANMMKDQRQRRKYCIKTITTQKDNTKYSYKPTPFSTYLNLKSNRRLKTSPCAEYDLSG